MEYPKYLYKHTNGSIIEKSKGVMYNTTPSEYFDSPFVIVWKKINNKEEEDKFRLDYSSGENNKEKS